MEGIPEKQLKSLIWIMKILAVLAALYLGYYQLFPALLATIHHLWPLILPFVLGVLLAALFDPIVDFVEQKTKLPRSLNVLFTMIVVIGGIVAMIVWIITRAVVELIKFSASLPDYSQNLVNWLEGIFRQAQIFYISLNLPQNWQQNFQSSVEKTTNTLINALDWSFGFVTAVPNVFLIIFFALISAYFFSRDKGKIRKAFYILFPAKIANLITNIGDETGIAIIGFLRAQLVLMLITMVETVVGLYILGVDYSLLIALFVGLVDVLPVLGPGAVFIPWIATLLFSGSVKLALALLVLYGIISIVRQVLQPKILGDSIGIHPLEALISLYIGLKVFGVLGVIIGPILLVIIKGLWRSKNESK